MRKQATCRCADEPCAILLLVGLMSGDELACVLGRTSRLLSDGGVLAVQLVRPSDDARVRAALSAAGMCVRSTVHDLSAGYLVTHTLERRAISLKSDKPLAHANHY